MEAVPPTSTGTEEGEKRRNVPRGNRRGSQQPSAQPNNQGNREPRGPRPPFINGGEQRQPQQPRPRNTRPSKPQTFQLGPLPAMPMNRQSAQDVASAQQIANAARKQFKIPASQRPSPGDQAVEELGTLLGMGDQPYDGQAAVAFMARNPTALAGLQGATTDRRPHYLRAQNIPDRNNANNANQDQNATRNNPINANRNQNQNQLHALLQGSTILSQPNQPLNGQNMNQSWRRPAGNQYPQPRPPASSQYVPPVRQNHGGHQFHVARIMGTRFQEPAVNIRQVLELLKKVPNPWPNVTEPFQSAYHYTLTHPDPRSIIPQELLDRSQQSPLTISILESWRASEPSQENKHAVVRILNQVNAVFQERYGQRFNFVIEPFGSVSWGGETGDTADVDMMLKDFDRPFGYTEDLWPKDGRNRPDIGPIYNVYALSRLLQEVGFIDVEPIKWATTPIVKFKDPTSGVSLDLNTNDLGGEANSRMILAYCRLAPFTLRPLIHIVKTWAKSRNLNDPSGSQGSPTLSSYCWTLMCIAYLQSIGKLPNLQDSDRVKNCGRENCVIWVSWGKPQGQAASVGFAEPLVDDDAAPQAPKDDIGDIVKGFFMFYYNMLRKDGDYDGEPMVVHNGQVPDTHRHVISIWKGGLTDRSIPIGDKSSGRRQKVDERKEDTQMDSIEGYQVANGDVTMTSGMEQNEQIAVAEEIENAVMDVDNQMPPNGRQQPRQQQPRGKRDRKHYSAEQLPRGPVVDGFAQPERWSLSDLVVQDPFLHDKNCASALSRPNYERVTRELERAVDILAQDEALDILFEKPDPRDTLSNRKKGRLNRQSRRIDRAAAAKAAKQAKGSNPELVTTDNGAQ